MKGLEGHYGDTFALLELEGCAGNEKENSENWKVTLIFVYSSILSNLLSVYRDSAEIVN